MIEASGERRSCETDDSSAERRRSVSLLTRASSRSATRRVRTTAWAMSSAMASARRRCSMPRRCSCGGKAQADHAGLGARPVPAAGTTTPSRPACRCSDPTPGGGAWPSRRRHGPCRSSDVPACRQLSSPTCSISVGVERAPQRVASGVQHLAQVGGAGQLPAQGLQRRRLRVGGAQRHHLHAQLRGQAPGDQRRDQEQHHRGHALARADAARCSAVR